MFRKRIQSIMNKYFIGKDNKNKKEENDETKKDSKQSNKRTIENLIVFVIILIITCVFINYIWNSNNQINQTKEDINTTNIETSKILADNTNKDNLETKLENILSKINGVRKCSSFDYILKF